MRLLTDMMAMLFRTRYLPVIPHACGELLRIDILPTFTLMPPPRTLAPLHQANIHPNHHTDANTFAIICAGCLLTRLCL